MRWEWLIIEIIVIGWAVVELVSVRRSLKRDRKSSVKGGTETSAEDARESESGL